MKLKKKRMSMLGTKNCIRSKKSMLQLKDSLKEKECQWLVQDPKDPILKLKAH